MIPTWPANSDGAKEELARDPTLKQRVDLKSVIEGDYFLEVVDSSHGNLLSAFLVRTGKSAFRLRSANSVGDWLILADNSNRVCSIR